MKTGPRGLYFRLQRTLVLAALGLAAGRGSQAAEVARFVDVGARLGFTKANVYGEPAKSDYILETTGTGVAIFDADGDGDNDVLLLNGSSLKDPGRKAKTPPYFYVNDGKGQFAELGTQRGLTETGWFQAACAADYDNDGDTDVFLTRYGSNVLYANDGKGSFSDATNSAKLPTSGTRWGAGCAFVDYDRDGNLDLAVSNYVDLDLATTPKPGDSATCKWRGLDVMCGPRGLPRATNILYRNRGDGTFVDVSQKSGIAGAGGRYGLGVVAADLDGDGWQDIYIACDMTASLLFRNQRDGTFKEVGSEAGVSYSFDGALQAGMGVAVIDYDGNGTLDIAKTNFSGDLPSLYSNDDPWFFTDLAQPAGLGSKQLLGWGAAWIDFDEDTWPDLVMANGHVYPEVDGGQTGERYRQPSLLYHNLGDGLFENVTAEAGPAFETARAGRGLATGDLDGDGRPEIVIVDLHNRPSVLRNEQKGANRAVVRLRGTASNRSAVGATVTLEAGARRQVQAVMSGGSYFSQHDLGLYFGLGAAERIERIAVRWPTGKEQRWQGLPANATISLIEDEPQPNTRPLPAP